MNFIPDPMPLKDELSAATENAACPSWLDLASLQFPSSQQHWFRNRMKFLARFLLHRRATATWIQRLALADMKLLAAQHPRLIRKLQYPYICADWEVTLRLRALLSHYDASRRLFARDSLASIYSSGLDLVRIQRSDAPDALLVRLVNRDQFAKEGELTLLVEDRASRLPLAGVTFSIVAIKGRRTLIIGGLQGSPSPQASEIIRRVAKTLHGLRAKSLAFWCVQELARYWAVDDLCAVGEGQHIYRGSPRHARVRATYDAFWAENEGLLLADGLWRLPLELRQRSRSELKASRRLAHERRYRFLEELRPKLLKAAIHAGPAREFADASLLKTEVLCFSMPQTHEADSSCEATVPPPRAVSLV
jgi:uncharacterized protein VirK/YbjX